MILGDHKTLTQIFQGFQNIREVFVSKEVVQGRRRLVAQSVLLLDVSRDFA